MMAMVEVDGDGAVSVGNVMKPVAWGVMMMQSRVRARVRSEAKEV
jgi:hypothetical protein